MRLYWLLLISLFAFQLTACFATKTRVKETYSGPFLPLVQLSNEPLVVTDETVIVDARSAFKYQMYHLPGSLRLSWEDFNQLKNKNFLKTDLYEVSRRLALYGLGPNVDVIVVGEGLKGEGEAGRVAWSLYYMGINRVQFVDIEFFKKNLSFKQRKKLKSISAWKPQYRETLRIQHSELKLKAKSSVKKHIIYLGDKKALKDFPKAHKMNFKDFIGAWGRPSSKIIQKLSSKSISKTDQIVLVSDRSVRSAAAALSLLSLGYAQVVNLDGGMSL